MFCTIFFIHSARFVPEGVVNLKELGNKEIQNEVNVFFSNFAFVPSLVLERWFWNFSAGPLQNWSKKNKLVKCSCNMNTTPSRYISFHFGNKKVFKKCIFDVNAMGKIEQLFRLFFLISAMWCTCLSCN